MKYRVMDLLACPVCKAFPLAIYVFEETKRAINFDTGLKEPLCGFFCGYYGKYVNQLYAEIDCRECMSRDVVWGALCCPRCKTLYPIVLGVPLMYPTYLRSNVRLKALYKVFLKKFGGKVEC